MPWQTITPMSQRQEFIEAVLHRTAQQTIKSLCAEFGITERTGHTWLARVRAGTAGDFSDRSHAPHIPAHQVSRACTQAICTLREAHPTWGARKLRAVLAAQQPSERWPAPSTITAVLRRAGLIVPSRRRRRDRAVWAVQGLSAPAAPNDVWTADFKGHFRVQAGPYCYPLTVSDLYSRYLLGLTALSSVGSPAVETAFRTLFLAYGLPRVIRTDNGVPFGVPQALGGLSRLAVWWIRLGIRPERIHKGEPQENGAHERMHRTLKAETTRPAASTLEAQQHRFARWQHTYNAVRPHEALGQTPPAQHYDPSPRAYPQRAPQHEYPARFELRQVSVAGSISWRGEPLYLSTVLAGEFLGLEQTAEGEWAIHLGPLTLGTYSDDSMTFTEQLAWTASPL